MRILVVGPPGSDTQTQAALLADHYEIPLISAGTILRNLYTTNTLLAAAVTAATRSGGNVPDDFINAVVAERVSLPDCRNGFVLQGYPRTLHQAGALDFQLAQDRVAVGAVVSIHVQANELVRRLTQRRPVDGEPANDATTAATRLRHYDEQTKPLLHTYLRRNLLNIVDGHGSAHQVFQRIIQALNSTGPATASLPPAMVH